MSKVKIYSISKKERMQQVGDFFDVVSGLRLKQEIIDFFIGLLTSSESLMLARRIQIAKKLIDNKGYEIIRKELKVSYQSISGVEKWLNAREGAYRKILTSWLDKNKRKKKKTDSHKSGSLLDRYPQHRFLKELLGL